MLKQYDMQLLFWEASTWSNVDYQRWYKVRRGVGYRKVKLECMSMEELLCLREQRPLELCTV